MNQGKTSRRCFLGFLLLVSIAILSVSNVPLAHAEEVAEAVVDATGDVGVQAEEEPLEAGGPVEEETNIVDEVTDAAKAKISEVVEDIEDAVEDKKKEIVEDIEDAVEDAKKKIEDAVEDKKEEIKDALEDAKKNIVNKVTATAQSKLSDIYTKIMDASPQQKKKIAAGALGVWGAAAGAGWVLNNLGGSDDE